MPLYRVRDGEVLAHGGAIHEAGARIELPRHVAEDPSVRGALQEVDAAGHAVASPPRDDLARFRAHERIGFLRERLTEAQARVTAITAQLAAEEQTLITEVQALTASRRNKPHDTPAAPAVKE